MDPHGRITETNTKLGDEVLQKTPGNFLHPGSPISQAVGPHNDHLATVKNRALRWYGQITGSSIIAKQSPSSTAPYEETGHEGDRRRDGKITSQSGLH